MITNRFTANPTRKLFRALLATVSLLAFCGALSGQSAPSSVGQWSKPSNWPSLATDASVIPNGKVLFWSSANGGDAPEIYDPIAKTFAAAAPSGFNMFSSGHTFLPNGQLFVDGGAKGTKIGLPNAAAYDPVGNSWTQLPDMIAGRYNPTATTLPNGDILIESGYLDGVTGPNRLPAVWQAVPGSWRYLYGAILGLPVTPWVFIGPDGRAMVAGPYATSYLFDTSGTGTFSVLGRTKLDAARSYGNAVTYDVGKVLILGGNDNPPTDTAEIIDLNVNKPAWSFTAPMAFPRQQPNATVLPDGTVLVTGGSSGSGFNNPNTPVFAAEIWNPATGNWSTMASASVFRGYDSIAVLLPDARVLTAGGSKKNGEIYSPPYLFNGARPRITSAPAQVNYGQTFFVATPDGASINRVTWVNLSSEAHGFNSSQRFNQLSFTQTSGGLNVTAPSGPTTAPAGHYMLFLLNTNGVPSIASVIQIVAAAPTVISISPGSGSTNGATPVTISGTNFLAGATVQIGGVVATNVQVTSGTTLTANTPAHSAGAVDIVVTNPDYQQGTLRSAYTYAQSQGISFVQENFTTKPKVVKSVTSTYSLSQVAGDLNLVVVGWNDATATVTSVTDSSGNSYAPAGGVVTGKALRQVIYYAKNIVAAGAGANTVTVQFNPGASFPDVRIFEYAGLDTANPLDTAGASSGNGLTASSGQVTTNAARELVFASDTVLSKTLSPGSGYVPIVRTTFFDIAEHQIASQTGNFNPSAALDAPTNWVMGVATFKAPGQ